MTRTRKSVSKLNLAKYDVYIEEREIASQYFRVSNLPEILQAGKNSFLIGASTLLSPSTRVLTEILDARGNSVFHTAVPTYIEGTSRMISVEVYTDTAPGLCTLIIMGQATNVPDEWAGKYNIRWSKSILIEPLKANLAPIILKNIPQVTASEILLSTPDTSSFAEETIPVTASLTSFVDSRSVSGYLIQISPPISAEQSLGILTGSIRISSDEIESQEIDIHLPITKVLNDAYVFVYNSQIVTTEGFKLESIMLYSGSYTTMVSNNLTQITSSVMLKYDSLIREGSGVVASYARLRVAPTTTFGGDIHKFKVSAKEVVESNPTQTSNYHTVAEAELTANNLLVCTSMFGDIDIGNFQEAPSASRNWYADTLLPNNTIIYPQTGSARYYSSSLAPTTPFNIAMDDSVLMRSIHANVPVDVDKFSGYVSESGYFIGMTSSVLLLPTTEYTLQFDAYYRQQSGSVILSSNTGSMDIYLVGELPTDNPLGTYLGNVSSIQNQNVRWFEQHSINFVPPIKINTSIRFVINSGFWNIANISLKPATDFEFTPDEITILVPNSDYYLGVVQYKIEFLNIDNKSINVVAYSQPTYFTGSSVDYGHL